MQLFSFHCYGALHLFQEMKLQIISLCIIIVLLLLAVSSTSCEQTWLIDDVMLADINFALHHSIWLLPVCELKMKN